jgi:hypothetical protein
MLLISSSEDRYGLSGVLVSARGLPLTRPDVPWAPFFARSSAHIHALVGDGKYGQAEQIQTFRCQAWRNTFTSRRNTPFYRLKTPSHQIAMVRISRWPKGWILRLLSVSSAFDKPRSRAFLYRAGEHAQTLHGRSHLATSGSRTSSWTNCACSYARCAGKIVLIWDGSPMHRAHEIKDFLSRGAAKRLHLKQLPGSAPDLTPDEGIWNDREASSSWAMSAAQTRTTCRDNSFGLESACATKPRSVKVALANVATCPSCFSRHQ